MTFLPIATRELRVSARNKATHRMRIGFALAGFLIAAVIMAFSAVNHGFARIQLGIWIFEALKWLSFIFACAAGVFLTADSLSEEKREGTLGLLFLTDLKGHDVVLGKLLATSLRTFYALLAIFPVMAFSFILGGIALDDFQHSIVAICNALFFSLALGVFVSVISRDSHKAMSATLGLLFVFVMIIPFALGTPAAQKVAWWLGLLSPEFAFQHTTGWNEARSFWTSIFSVQAESWCLLGLASWLAPKTWQEKGVRVRTRRQKSPGAVSKRLRLLERNPVCWIIARDKWGATIARLAILLTVVLFILSVVFVVFDSHPLKSAQAGRRLMSTTTQTMSHSTTSVIVTSGLVKNGVYSFVNHCNTYLAIAIDFWIAAQVARFYVEGRKTGFLELLRVTPVKPLEVLQGHWMALRRLFLPAAVCLAVLQLICGGIGAWVDYSTMNSSPPPMTSRAAMDLTTLLMSFLGTLNWFIGLFAIAWFSIWTGMRSKGTSLAMLKTFCFAKAIPWVAVTVVSGFLMMSMAQFLNGGKFWIWPVIFNGGFFLTNVFLIALARHKARQAVLAWPD